MPVPPAKRPITEGTIFGIFSGLLNDSQLNRSRALGIIADLAEESGVDVAALLAEAVERKIASEQRKRRKPKTEKKRAGRRSMESTRREIKETSDQLMRSLAKEPAEKQPVILRRWTEILRDDPRIPPSTQIACRVWLEEEELRDDAKKAGRLLLRARASSDDQRKRVPRWAPWLKPKRTRIRE